MYRLSLFYLVAVLAHLKLRTELAVVQAGFKSPALIQSVIKGQRPCDRHLVMACTKDLIITRTIGVAQCNTHNDAAGLFTCCIQIVGQIDGVVTPIVDAAWNCRTCTRV